MCAIIPDTHSQGLMPRRAARAPGTRRLHIYAIVAVFFFGLSLLAVSFKSEFDLIVSDGRGYYVYLPSLLIDGDLDFSDEIQEYWGPDFSPQLLSERTGPGLIPNKYPIGLSLTLLPSFVFAHALSALVSQVLPAASLRPDGYSLLYQLAGLGTIIVLGLITMLLLDRILRRHYGLSPGAALLAILTLWTGTHYTYYYFREPFMAHVVSTFWVTAAIALVFETLDSKAQRSPRQIAPLLVFCTCMAVICRPTNIFLALYLPLIFSRVPLRGLVPRGWTGGLLYGLAITPLALQLLTWKVLYGSWIYYSYTGEGFRWSQPALVQTLFSSRHGLFMWSPVLFFAAWGLVRYRRDWMAREPARTTTLYTIVTFVVLWYVNSSWHQWWFGDSFGGRSFLEMLPLFALGLGLLIERLQHASAVRRRAALAGLILSMIYTYGLMYLYISHRISRSDFLF